MKLSVVIPTRDKRPLLERTLGALAEQTLASESWEAIVVDDDSSDDTAAWLSREAAHWGGRLKVVSPTRNVGRAAARNLGAAAAAGDRILFLDDDVLAPHGLLAAHAELGAAYPGDGAIGLVRTDPELVDAPHFRYIDTRGAAKVGGDFVPARYLVTQNTAVPTRAFRSVAGFDESFRAYGFEDMELGFRLEDAGVRFRPLREPVPLHLHHHTQDAWLAKKRECGRGSLLPLVRRHPERRREMRLHWLVDARGKPARGIAPALLRIASRPGAAGALQRLLAVWPTDGAHDPRFRSLYGRGMDLLVMTAYCQGLSEAFADPPEY